jgi:hypothetical protein
MHLFLDICQGLGLAAAAGIRPFFPAFVAGIYATANWGVNFDDTSFAFLESGVWIGCVAALMVLSFVLRRMGEDGPSDAAIGGVGIGLGALLFAGTLDDHGHDALGVIVAALIGGALVAALGQAVYRTLAGRTAQRLDEQARNALPLWFDGVAGVLAALSVAAPPISLAVLPLLAWLVVSGRRREGGKHAGLRTLR